MPLFSRQSVCSQTEYPDVCQIVINAKMSQTCLLHEKDTTPLYVRTNYFAVCFGSIRAGRAQVLLLFG